MIDLRKCKKGDKLRIRMVGRFKEDTVRIEGENPCDIVTYVRMVDDADEMWPHIVEYKGGMRGSRGHEGNFAFAFTNNRRDDDPDVIEVLERSDGSEA